MTTEEKTARLGILFDILRLLAESGVLNPERRNRFAEHVADEIETLLNSPR